MDEAEPAGDARFDPSLGAWVLTRHADVSAALRDPRLSASGTSTDDTAHIAAREATLRALAPPPTWRAEVEASALALAERLPEGVPVDLVGSFARLWAAMLAARTTGAPPADAERLDRLAREVFLASACATDTGFPPRAQAAVVELADSFPRAGASAGVQAYVALSQTLPCFLAGAWRSLFGSPDEADRLRADPRLMPNAVEELLRHAGPSRAVFRIALAEASFGPATVAAGDRVILMLSAANHDLARFSHPGRLDVGRDAAGHLAFGAGPHACPGASLIRMAVRVATGALLRATKAVEPAGEVEWIGGFAIRAPATLPVVLRRQRPST